MTQISILGVDNVLFAVGDLAAARAFYEDRLGLKVKFAAPEHGIVGYALGSEEPGLVLRQEVLADSTPRATPKVWLEVADARAAAQILEGAGILPLTDPFEIRTGWAARSVPTWARSSSDRLAPTGSNSQTAPSASNSGASPTPWPRSPSVSSRDRDTASATSTARLPTIGRAATSNLRQPGGHGKAECRATHESGIGAGDGSRTRDIQLGRPKPLCSVAPLVKG